MRAGEAQLPERRAVGAQLVGDQQLRCEALFLEQLAHQPECCLRISPTLNEHVENLALVVDGAPQAICKHRLWLCCQRRLGYWGQPLLLFFIFHAADRIDRLGWRRLLRLQ